MQLWKSLSDSGKIVMKLHKLIETMPQQICPAKYLCMFTVLISDYMLNEEFSNL